MKTYPCTRALWISSTIASAFVGACVDTENPAARPITQAPAGGGDGGATARDGGKPADDASASPNQEAGPPVDANESAAPISLSSLTGGDLVGAASTDGSAMAIVQGAGEPISFAHYEPGSGWTALAPLPGGSSPSTGPLIGMDAAGNAFVAWTQNNSSLVIENVVRYDHASRTWSAVAHPDPSTETLGIWLTLSVNAGGDAMLVDTHDGSGTRDLYAQHYSAASKAWTVETIAAQPLSASTRFPVVALATDGSAILSVTSATGVAFRRSPAGVWTAAPKTDIPGATSVGVNAAGDAVVAWEDLGTTPWAYRYEAALGAWTDPVQLSTAPESAIYGACPLTVGVSTSGDATIARCYSGANVTRTLEYYTFAKATKSWSPKKSIATSGSPFSVWFAFDARGEGLAIWSNAPTSSFETSPAVVSTYAPTTGWSPQSAPLGGNSTRNVGVFLSPEGRSWASWNEASGLKLAKVR